MGEIRGVWWNLGNFFDTDDDPISKDFEYTEAGGWTEKVYQAKKNNLAEALNAVHNGKGPELLAVCEIEKDAMLDELIKAMSNEGLKVVEEPSGTRDLRGIDVAMAYDKRKLELLSGSVKSHVVHLRYPTRDILEVKFKVRDTGEELIVFACHWPSRYRGTHLTEPLRIAVTEHLAYLIRDHVKMDPREYEQLRDENNIEPVEAKWETKVLIVGDLNDQPGDRSVVEHLKATNELDRVLGKTNDIDGFKDETAKYREQPVFLYNAAWKLLPPQDKGTYFIDSTRTTGKVTNRFLVLDQVVASRGLVQGSGLRLNIQSVKAFRDPPVATGSGRPKKFDKKRKKGCSDHLPVTFVLEY